MKSGQKHSLLNVGSSNIAVSPKSSLIEQSEWYKLLVDSIQDYAIFLLDIHGNIATWNPGAQKFKGYKANEIIGKHFSNFYTQKDRDNKKPETELKVAMRDGRVEDEGWRVRKDGTRFWANVVITALFDNSGKLQGFAKVTRDLTERKKAEDSLREMNKKLRHQQAELKKLNKSKDEFISLASHQLRTPATIVKQYLGILLLGIGTPLNTTQTDLVKKAQISNDRQLQIVNDLLKVAQIDSGKVTLKTEVVEISAFIKTICEEETRILDKKNQTIKIVLPGYDVCAEIDPSRFRMAIENMVNNASKYSHEGGIIKLILSKDKRVIRLDITDKGVGISKADTNKLFKQFSRIPNSLSDQAGGSGLGLYWANKVINLHGGKITVSSEIGKGSTFTVKLPGKITQS